MKIPQYITFFLFVYYFALADVYAKALNPAAAALISNVNVDLNADTIKNITDGAERMAHLFAAGLDSITAPKISKL